MGEPFTQVVEAMAGAGLRLPVSQGAVIVNDDRDRPAFAPNLDVGACRAGMPKAIVETFPDNGAYRKLHPRRYVPQFSQGHAGHEPPAFSCPDDPWQVRQCFGRVQGRRTRFAKQVQHAAQFGGGLPPGMFNVGQRIRLFSVARGSLDAAGSGCADSDQSQPMRDEIMQLSGNAQALGVCCALGCPRGEGVFMDPALCPDPQLRPNKGGKCGRGGGAKYRRCRRWILDADGQNEQCQREQDCPRHQPCV